MERCRGALGAGRGARCSGRAANERGVALGRARASAERQKLGGESCARRVVAGDAESYQYLVESIRMFPDQEAWARQIEDAGFRGVEYENLTCGVVAIHSGFKLD